MKVLVLVTRFPFPGTKGDQLRAWSWIQHLAAEHSVTVLTPGAPERLEWREELAALAMVREIPAGPGARAASALGALSTGHPAQVGWMMPRATWRAAVREASTADVVLAVTVRAVRGPLGAPVVIDHVDALSLNMARRADGVESLPVRAFARLEAALLRRHERFVGAFAHAHIVTSEEDADALPYGAQILPTPYDAEPFDEPARHVRDIDVVLSGNMRYPPNRAAAELLATEILPRVRERRPVRAVVVGRAADRLRLIGVEIASDVEDVGAYLRRSKVAVAPLQGGTGSPNKVLEAAAAGAALVTVPWAAARYGIAAETAETPEAYATAIVGLLEDEARRSELVAQARPAVLAHLTPRIGARLEATLRTAARSRTAPTAAG